MEELNADTGNFEMRRLQYDVAIGCNDDWDEAKRLMLEALATCEGVLTEPAPEVILVALADFSNNIRFAGGPSQTVRMSFIISGFLSRQVNNAIISYAVPASQRRCFQTHRRRQSPAR